MSAVSTRDTIIAEIKSTLAGIKTTSGYNLTVSKIYGRMKSPEDLNPDDFPAFIVIDGPETKADASKGEMKNELSVIITGYIWNAGEDYDLQADVRKLLADVEKCLCADRYRGALSINTLPREIRTDEGMLRPYGIFDFTFSIPYLQLYGVP